MPTLYLAVGLPGSGKTTEFDRRVAEARAAGGRACRISRDDVRSLLFGAPGFGIDEQAVSSIQGHTIRLALKAGVDVYVDDTNMKAEHLERLTIARDAAREHPVGETVIRRMLADRLAQQEAAR